MEEKYFERKSKFDSILDFLVFISLFVVTIFLILEILSSVKDIGVPTEVLDKIYFPIGIIVFIVFSVDLYRLYKYSDSFTGFLYNNFLDIIATIPFTLILTIPGGEVLKTFRVLRLGKLSRSGKIVKEFKAAGVLKKKSDDYKKKNRV